jgi:hypothetical protein
MVREWSNRSVTVRFYKNNGAKSKQNRNNFHGTGTFVNKKKSLKEG